MDNGTGLELSILEGMDEALLERLHQAGIRTRGELASRITTSDGRQVLARELGVSARRLQILHHLNFLTPEERAERELDVERRVKEHADEVARERRRVRRNLTLGLVGLGILAVVLVFVARQAQRENLETRRALETRVEELTQSVNALSPIGRAYAEERVLAGLNALGPAPGWVAPRPWTAATHEQLSRLLVGDPTAIPPRAVSLLLLRLSELEEAAPDSLTPLARARAAADLLAEFPPPDKIETVWDAAAVLLRTRIRGRAFGLAPMDGSVPLLPAATVWEWTSPGFLACEELLSRLEAAPIRVESLDAWSSSLLEIREAAEGGRQDCDGLPQAHARDYWLRRSEMEYAVTAALLGRSHLLPYHASMPRAFLELRRAYLNQALEAAPPAAKPGLAWLAVEYEEALRLVDWLTAQGVKAPGTGAATWVDALAAVEQQRTALELAPGAGVEWAVGRAVQLSGEGSAPWTAGRTRVEAGIRPLLMETRAGSRGRSAPSRTGS